MSTQLPPLSACVTKILSLSGFTPDLKTRDIQQAFSDWETTQGGFKIKWVNDTSLYIVFADPTIAKRAYLQAIFAPPAIFESPTTGQLAKIKPYDGPDAQNVITAVNSRGNGGPPDRRHSTRASISVGGGMGGVHARMGSGVRQNPFDIQSSQLITIPASSSSNMNREPSPTLPSLPAQPTLNSLITSSLSSEHLPEPSMAESASAPRIGDPGKRMVAHSLGMKHPSLVRSQSGDDISSRVHELSKGLHGVTVTE